MQRLKQYVMWGGRLVVGICFIWLTYLVFDLSYILSEVKQLFGNFWLVMTMTCFYLAAFIIRAKAWQLYVGRHLGMKVFVDGVMYSLFINHLLPIKAGDIVRTGFLAQSEKVTWKTALQSVVVMRVLDLMILGLVAISGVLYLGLSFSYLFLIILMIGGGLLLALLLLKEKWRNILLDHARQIISILFSAKGMIIFILIILSWCLEAVVIFAIATQFSTSLTYLQSLWVNSFTIAGQVFHFSPGGIGTYESFMSFALAAYQVPIKEAYTIAVITHGFKFIFSFVIGIYLILSVPISWTTIKHWLKRKED